MPLLINMEILWEPQIHWNRAESYQEFGAGSTSLLTNMDILSNPGTNCRLIQTS